MAESEHDLGRMLRERRHRTGLGQQQLAERAGVSVRTVRDIENGRVRRPQALSVQKLLAALAATNSPDADRPAGAVDGRAPSGTHRGTGIEILGPLTVRRAGQATSIGQPMLRTMLGLLALHAGDIVSIDAAVDIMWAESPPRTCSNIVRAYVSRLRQLIEPERSARAPYRSIVRVGDGYLLDPAVVDVDAARFQTLVRAAAGIRKTDGDGSAALYLQALHLWRGPVLSAADQRLREHPAVVGLTRSRIEAVIALAELELAAGHVGQSLPLIHELAAAHPLHEPLHARLIAALAASNQRAAAIEAFARIRHHLNQQLGIAPGKELQDAYRRVMRDRNETPTLGSRPAAAVSPAHLPPAVQGFTGRAAQLAHLDTFLAEADTQITAARLIVISGTGGVGKTALALHWAHHLKDRFPDGQLYVNLRGYDPGGVAMHPTEALHRFLQAFAIPTGSIPQELNARSDMFRSVVSDKRLLVLLDNALDADQIRPLLPGGAGCLVLVTSRDAVTSLIVMDGAQPLHLGVLAWDEALAMLAQRIGKTRTAAAPHATATIAHRCAGLPLALALAAARATAQPGLSLRSLATDLEQEAHTLDALEIDDSNSLRPVLSWSYRRLSPAGSRVFRLFGIHPRPDASAEVLASLAGLPVRDIRAVCGELIRGGLLTQENDRYTSHDLLHRYAGELASASTDDDPDSARRRMLDHYLHAALAAADHLESGRQPIETPPADQAIAVPVITDHEQALRWFTTEHSALTAIVDLAVGTAAHGHTWRLGLALAGYLDNQGHWDDWIHIMRSAVLSARVDGDPAIQARTERVLARGYAQVGAHHEARTHYENALRLYAAADDVAGRAATHFSLAWMADNQNDPTGSLYHAEQALTLYQEAEHLVGQGRALNLLGWKHAVAGNLVEALALCQQAMTIQQKISDTDGEAATWDSIGYINAQRGEPGAAISCYEESLVLFRRSGDRLNEAEILDHLGDAHQLAGNHQEARASWRQAVTILQQLGHPGLNPIMAKLGRHH